MNSADQIDQLDALRFKAQMESKNLSRGKIEKISGNEIPGLEEETRMGKPIENTAIPLGKLKLKQFGGMVPLCEVHMREYMEWGP